MLTQILSYDVYVDIDAVDVVQYPYQIEYPDGNYRDIPNECEIITNGFSTRLELDGYSEDEWRDSFKEIVEFINGKRKRTY